MITYLIPRTKRIDAIPRWTGETYEGKLVYVVDVALGALPNTGTNLIPHGLTLDTVVDVGGTATNGAVTVSFD